MTNTSDFYKILNEIIAIFEEMKNEINDKTNYFRACHSIGFKTEGTTIKIELTDSNGNTASINDATQYMLKNLQYPDEDIEEYYKENFRLAPLVAELAIDKVEHMNIMAEKVNGPYCHEGYRDMMSHFGDIEMTCKNTMQTCTMLQTMRKLMDDPDGVWVDVRGISKTDVSVESWLVDKDHLQRAIDGLWPDWDTWMNAFECQVEELCDEYDEIIKILTNMLHDMKTICDGFDPLHYTWLYYGDDDIPEGSDLPYLEYPQDTIVSNLFSDDEDLDDDDDE